MTDRPPVFRVPQPGMPVTVKGPHGPFQTRVIRVIWQDLDIDGAALVAIDCSAPKQMARIVRITQDQIAAAAGWQWDQP